MSVESLKASITPNTKAIMLVHGLGFNALNDEIIKIAKENNLLLLEDVCESHGAKFKDKRVGSFGDLSSFSFYFGHHMTTIEGGMLCTDNEEIYQLAKMFRSHGFVRESSQEVQSFYKEKYPELNPLFTFAVAGFNMRSTELNAVLGIEQLKRLDYNIEIRRNNFKTWIENLNPNMYYVDYDLEGNSNFALPLIMQESFKDRLHINDDYSSVCDILELNKVEYRLGTIGGGSQIYQPYILNSNSFKTFTPLTNSDIIHKNSLYIGNHPELTEEQIIELCKKLNNV